MVLARRLTLAIVVLAVVAAFAPQAPRAAAGGGPTIDQFLAPGYPTEVASARKADRIAWTAYERGMRNVYTAAAPDFKPARITSVTKDDGVELSDVDLSDDGTIVVFVRGTQPNREGWVANPTAETSGAARTVWAARTAGGTAWKVGEVTTPVLSPDGHTIVYAKDGQIRSLRDRWGRRGRKGRWVGWVYTVVQSVGREFGSQVVARWHEARVCQRPRRPQLCLRVRRAYEEAHLPGAERRSRYEPDVVGRRQARRVHPPARHAVRTAGASGQRKPWESKRTRI